jgi:hypothetical protein
VELSDGNIRPEKLFAFWGKMAESIIKLSDKACGLTRLCQTF